MLTWLAFRFVSISDSLTFCCLFFHNSLRFEIDTKLITFYCHVLLSVRASFLVLYGIDLPLTRCYRHRRSFSFCGKSPSSRQHTTSSVASTIPNEKSPSFLYLAASKTQNADSILASFKAFRRHSPLFSVSVSWNHVPTTFCNLVNVCVSLSVASSVKIFQSVAMRFFLLRSDGNTLVTSDNGMLISTYLHQHNALIVEIKNARSQKLPAKQYSHTHEETRIWTRTSLTHE